MAFKYYHRIVLEMFLVFFFLYVCKTTHNEHIVLHIQTFDEEQKML